jgi:Tfp pilus assembly protein PilO
MHQDFTVKKRAILIVLGLLVSADIGLAVYSWQLASSPKTSQKEFDEQNLKLMLLKGDIKSAQDIKDNMPATRKDCEKFEQSLPSQSIGASSLSTDLDETAKKAGLQIATLSTKPKELPSRGMIEVTIEASVTGDYSGVAKFVNALQRSQKFYIIDELALSTEMQAQKATGPIKVGLHLRTYFREAA